ncbi:phage late control D family protein [Fusobacterium ulcerans]|uniref:phage late control D family protein n=1 Tax=Fusobacterium ulcerans TaxID=861 RepID=UPI003FED8AFD
MLNEDLKKVIGEAREIKLEVFYEGKDITDYIHKDLINFSQSDSLNEFDTIELSLENRDRLWMNGWKPLKGEKIEAKAYLYNWENEGTVSIKIGTFYIDNISYSGPPDIVNIKAISVDITKDIMDSRKNRVWERVTIKRVAQDIAKACNLELIFESDFNRVYTRLEIKMESYFTFLKKIAEEAGINVKLYNDRLILFEEEMYEKKKPVMTLSRKDLKSYSFEEEDTDTYTGCTISYWDSWIEKKIEVTFKAKKRIGYKKETQRILFINEEKCPPGETDSQKRAYLSKIAAKALKEKNKNSIKGNISMMGKEKLLSVGDTLNINEFGQFNGKYIISEITIDFLSYDLSIQIRKVLEEEK